MTKKGKSMDAARQHLMQLPPHARERDTAKHLLEALNEIDRLRLLGDEPMRVIAVEAIREVTGCPDIGGNGKYLVDVLMDKVRDFVTPNAQLTGEDKRSLAESSPIGRG